MVKYTRKAMKEQIHKILSNLYDAIEKTVSSANEGIKQYVSCGEDEPFELSNVIAHTDSGDNSDKPEYDPNEHYRLVALKKQTSERRIYTNNLAIDSYTEAAIKANESGKRNSALVATAKVDSLKEQNDNLQRIVMHYDKIITGIRIRMDPLPPPNEWNMEELDQRIREMQEQAKPILKHTEAYEALEELIDWEIENELHREDTFHDVEKGGLKE